MKTLARSHPKSFKTALFDVPIILHDLLLILSFLFYDPIWNRLSSQETKDSMACIASLLTA
jgi:hypothetical protein